MTWEKLQQPTGPSFKPHVMNMISFKCEYCGIDLFDAIECKSFNCPPTPSVRLRLKAKKVKFWEELKNFLKRVFWNTER